MGWLHDIFRNNRRLEEIELEELKLLQLKSRELKTLLEEIAGIMEIAIRDIAEKTSAERSHRQPMRILLPNHHEDLMKKIRLIETNLQEEIEKAKDLERKEKKYRE